MTDEEIINCTKPELQLERLVAIMHRLRAPGGCPWDAEQTHESLITNVIEEAYEVVEAIQRQDSAGIREELGDLLLQVVFHAEIAQEKNQFSLEDVAQEISEKLIRRHPHVFGENQADTPDAVLLQWDKIKRQEKNAEDKPYLHGTAKGLPALLRAWKLQKKAAKVGFDWENIDDVINKIKEELGEVEETLQFDKNDRRREEELGDLLFSVVNLCRKQNIDPEVALAGANKKFESRFHVMDQHLQSQGNTLIDASLDEMEAGWQQAKKLEK